MRCAPCLIVGSLLCAASACADDAPRAAPDTVASVADAAHTHAGTDTSPADGDDADVDRDVVPPWTPAAIPGAHWYLADQGTTLDAPLATAWRWDQPGLGDAPWHPRDGAGLVYFRDRLWLLGGWYVPGVPAWGGEVTTNEVWSSPDLGATWTLELAHDPAPPTTGPDARWLPRHTFGHLVVTFDGVAWIYVIGGDIYHVTSDVWRSRDGVAWELVTDQAPWGGRVLHMSGVLGTDLYVMGGQLDIADPATALADVWRSRDGGATWERLTDAPWAPRGMTYHLAEHRGRLWLAGGGTYDDAPRSFYDDVWSFDGATWERATAAAPWVGREYHNVTAFAGELWVSSGWAADELNHNDVWHSADGVVWSELVGSPFLPGHADGVAVGPDVLLHASGNAMDTTVHRLARSTTRSAPVSRWDDRGGDADLLAAGRARPLLVEGAFAGGDAGLWLDGSDAFMHLAEREAHPSGRSVFWVGRTGRTLPWRDYVDPSMTVVGDSTGSCRAQAGYSGDQAALVVTDATGAWSDGHVLRGAGVTDDTVHLVGFTQALDGTTVAYLDGVPQPPVAHLSYDAAYMGWDRLGAGFADGDRAQVMLALVVVVPAVVSDADIAALARYAARWTAAP